MRTRLVVLSAVLIWAAACSETASPPITAPSLSANKLRELEQFSEGGCAAIGEDSTGSERGFIVPTRMLPFKSNGVSRKSAGSRDNGRSVRLRIQRPNGKEVKLNCWLPNSLGKEELTAALKGSYGGRWKSIFENIAHAPKLPSKEQRVGLSPEASFLYEGTSTPQRQKATKNEGPCYDIEAVISIRIELGDPNDLSDDIWISVFVEMTVCRDDEPMSQPLWWWMIDNGYGSYPYVMLDADRNAITQLDTVTFTADYSMPCCGIPYIYGWTWTPTPGTSDPWTQACVGTSTTCRIAIHGSGTMRFMMTVQGSSDWFPAYASIVADPPPDVGDWEGDVVSGGGGGGGGSGNIEVWSPWVDGQKTSGPFAPEMSPWFSSPISVSQSTAIWVNAISMGEWKYTQGCAHCDSVVANRGEFTEDPVNYALRRGDCTDFVYLAIENVLLSSWNHDKISTSMYNNSTATQLDSYGFTEVTLANARMGDVVVRTKTDGCLCGHAGLFAGRGVGGSIVGYANNGIPARPGQKNVDSTTSVYDFRVKEGYVTKLFRPVVP